MNRIGMKGGANDLEVVLGENFHQFIGMLEQRDFQQFWCEKNKGQGASPPGADDKDIHPKFFQYLTAATLAFREIESPAREYQAVAEKYRSTIRSIVDSMVAGKSIYHAVPYTATQYLYHQEEPSTQLIPGFNLFPSTSAFYKQDPSNYTTFVNLIKFLFHFIALLDLNNL